MTGEQGSLFETPPDQRPPERSMDEIAAHMAAHAPADPYAAQEAREADIVAQRDGDGIGSGKALPGRRRRIRRMRYAR